MSGDQPGKLDEFDAYLAEALKDPAFARAYKAATLRLELRFPGPLCIDGHAYHRRQMNRRKRRRR